MEDDRAAIADDPEHGYIVAPTLRRATGGAIVAYAIAAGAIAGMSSPDLREMLFPILMAPALLERDYALVFEMDADFSHDPQHIPQFLETIAEADLVIGSRYREGRVTVVNWPIGRLLLSYFANVYARFVTGLPIHDSTAGYKCFRRKVLEAIDLSDVKSNGYAFQIEMHFRVWRKKFRVVEIPIVFVDRTEGASKMSKKIIREAVWMVWRLRWWALTGRV